MFIVKHKETGEFIAKGYGDWHREEPKAQGYGRNAVDARTYKIPFTTKKNRIRVYSQRGHIVTSIGIKVTRDVEEETECPTCHQPYTRKKKESKLILPEWAEVIEVDIK